MGELSSLSRGGFNAPGYFDLPPQLADAYGLNATLWLDFTRNLGWRNGQLGTAAQHISCSRSTSKMEFDGSGNWLEFAANEPAITGLGLSAHRQATNLVAHSVDVSRWNINGDAAVASGVVAPDGSATAYNISSVGRSGSVGVFTRPTQEPNKTYTLSFYIRPDVEDVNGYWRLGFEYEIYGGGHSGLVRFNPTTKEWLEIQEGVGAYGWEPAHNGYLRVWVTATTDDVDTTNAAVIFYASRDIASDFWGFQLEEGIASTPYVPTNGSPVTRAADVVTLKNPELLPSEGTWFIEFDSGPGWGNGSRRTVLMAILSNGGNAQIAYDANNGKLWSRGENHGIATQTPVPNSLVKLAYRKDGSDITVFVNGSKYTFTDDFEMDIRQLRIGHNNGAQLDSHIRKLVFFPTISDGELERITAS
ncbi:phage head spike fiber domain-containing protein [Pseudovibrio japonicus]|nr:hypothetical protein [Pseudovibrio japonicus]